MPAMLEIERLLPQALAFAFGTGAMFPVSCWIEFSWANPASRFETSLSKGLIWQRHSTGVPAAIDSIIECEV